MTATRLPSKLTGSCGQRAVWQDWPLKLSMPSILGMVGADRGPMAVIRKRQVCLLPSSRVTCQLRVSSCQCAAVTRLLNWMSRRRSNLSATWFRYFSVCGCGEKCSVQCHSSRSSWEKE
jgi:hypothetical protein